MIYTCDAICKTHDKICCCSCSDPHQKRFTSKGSLITNGCYKENPFDEEKSLHYHEDCYFDDTGISLTENLIDTFPVDTKCTICNERVTNIAEHLKEKHNWLYRYERP